MLTGRHTDIHADQVPYCACVRRGLIIDESTDVAVIGEMVVYAHYVTATKIIKTALLNIIDPFSGTAQTIEKALLDYKQRSSTSKTKWSWI